MLGIELFCIGIFHQLLKDQLIRYNFKQIIIQK